MAMRAKEKTQGKLTGRPSEYTDECADKICRLLVEGKSLRQICAANGMPDRNTVMNWLDAYPAFAAKHARARERQAEFMDDLILEVANGSTAETASADRVKIGAYQWRAGRLAPKKYGDRTRHEHTGANGGAIKVASLDPAKLAMLSEEELAALERAYLTLGISLGDPSGEGEEGGAGAA